MHTQHQVIIEHEGLANDKMHTAGFFHIKNFYKECTKAEWGNYLSYIRI